jgi:hypothetical protein
MNNQRDPRRRHDPYLAKAKLIALAIASAFVGLAWLAAHYL